MEHAGGREHHHGARVVDVGPVEGLDVSEVEHVPLDKRLPDLLVCPGDEHLVVVVRLLRHAGTAVQCTEYMCTEPVISPEVYRTLEVHPLPVGLEEDAELLGAAQGEHWDEDLAALSIQSSLSSSLSSSSSPCQCSREPS